MKKVERSELLDWQTYNDRRAELRAYAMGVKRPRRIHVGRWLTFLFENSVTIRYQIQEMMRVEQLVRESDILHELDTYNDVLGGPGQLGFTLLIEIESPETRSERLRAWLALPQHIYALLADGTKIRPSFDARQVGDERLSSVQYMKFDTRGLIPVALGVDLPDYAEEATLTPEQRAALEQDLAG